MPFRAKKGQKPKRNVVLSPPLAPTVACPHCGGADNPIKWDKRKRKRREPAQRRPCKDCNRTFTHDPGFPGMHLPASIVRYAPLLHAMKLSAVKTRLALIGAPKIAVSVHPDTVRRRRAHCAKMAWKFVSGMVVWSSGIWSIDEKFVRVNEKGQYVYVVMGATTKFALAWEVTGDKLNGYDARGLLARALEMVDRPPRRADQRRPGIVRLGVPGRAARPAGTDRPPGTSGTSTSKTNTPTITRTNGSTTCSARG